MHRRTLKRLQMTKVLNIGDFKLSGNMPFPKMGWLAQSDLKCTQLW
jgi:hypothetical protein